MERWQAPGAGHDGAVMAETTKIGDVARLARVSPSTVSNVLNGRHDRMRPETRERVRQAIAQLGYAPSQVARQLKTGAVPIVGLIVPSVANPFWGAVARYVEEAALARGYQVLLCNAERDPERERRYAAVLWSHGVRGVIFGSSPLSFDHLLDLARRGLRVVAFDRQTQSADRVVVDSVAIDNALGGRLATEHLLDLGHRRIGFLSGPIRTVSRLDRLAGYHAALAAAGLAPDPALVWEGRAGRGLGDSEGAELGRAGAQALLAGTAPPTALVAINDMYALGACAGIRDRGLRIPGDVSVVGFDDIAPLAEIAAPPLTTVRQPLRAMMRAAVERLIGRVEGTPNERPAHLIAIPELVVRASTAPPAARPAGGRPSLAVAQQPG